MNVFNQRKVVDVMNAANRFNISNGFLELVSILTEVYVKKINKCEEMYFKFSSIEVSLYGGRIWAANKVRSIIDR